jgi:asparagine synthase (glutamine-hydrolysing)
MCGIAGYAGIGSRDELERMIGALAHRGPDDRGVWVGERVGLGLARLAIIDLATGQQPMTNEDGSLRIVCNGEIYNYRQLAADLAGRGHRFTTRSDTEVILHAWETWGDAALDRLRGMFAFALWDERRAEVVLARDRLGKKPLYYVERPGAVRFASEPKALLLAADVSRELDWDAFHHYLAYGCTPGDRSMFGGIRKLPPGSIARIRNGALTVHRYWALPAPAGGTAVRGTSRDALATRVRAIVRDAVRVRLESDVPLGVFLSGGVDSSAVLAAMREVTSGTIATFTVGFGGASMSFDERRYARLVATRFGTDHHEDVLEPKVADLLVDVVRAFDEPFADSSAVPTFAVAQATARHVKVALSGIGGDETFAGYPRYLGVRCSEWYARVPHAMRYAASFVARSVLTDSERSRNWSDRLRRFLATERRMPDRYLAWTRFFAERDLTRLVTPGIRERWTTDVDTAAREAFAGHAHRDVVDGAVRIDLATYLPNDLLAMADRMSMAHGLEVRAPFCDHELIAESLAIATSAKLRGMRLKGLLKLAFADALPREVLAHPKQGFMIPLGRWLRDELRPVMADLLDRGAVHRRGVFRSDAVEALVREHLAGRGGHADRLWTLMMFELWAREYLDR